MDIFSRMVIEGHVPRDGILIDAADAAMALMLRHVGDVLVADQDFALVDWDGAADDVEQRRFARTIGADDADELPYPEWRGRNR